MCLFFFIVARNTISYLYRNVISESVFSPFLSKWEAVALVFAVQEEKWKIEIFQRIDVRSLFWAKKIWEFLWANMQHMRWYSITILLWKPSIPKELNSEKDLFENKNHSKKTFIRHKELSISGLWKSILCIFLANFWNYRVIFHFCRWTQTFLFRTRNFRDISQEVLKWTCPC